MDTSNGSAGFAFEDVAVGESESEFPDKREFTKHPDRGVATIRQNLLADGAPMPTRKNIVLMRRRTASHVQDVA
jgi:hypothetical protein